VISKGSMSDQSRGQNANALCHSMHSAKRPRPMGLAPARVRRTAPGAGGPGGAGVGHPPAGGPGGWPPGKFL
jgi:hypothetical protein